jgi:hypothetical protein
MEYDRGGVHSGRTSKSETCLRMDDYRKGEQDRTVVVLGPPVASAQDAVKAAMASKAKK